jgi:hypothetical protein
MASISDSCHLLRIPLEIRYSIYDLVIHFIPPSDTVWKYKGGYANGEFYTTIFKDADTSFSLPWVNLLLTSKVLSEELRAYMSRPSGVDKHTKSCWELDIVAVQQGHLKTAQWRQLTCHPADVNTLVANIEFPDQRILFWGCGGPRPIVRQLYQSLNGILHYGPTFAGVHLLSQHLRLKTLVLNLRTTPPDQSGVSSDTRNYRGHERFAELTSEVENLKKTGLLWSYIENIRIVDDDSHMESEMEIYQVNNPKVPEFWDKYGFEWGPDGTRRITPKDDSTT